MAVRSEVRALLLVSFATVPACERRSDLGSRTEEPPAASAPAPPRLPVPEPNPVGVCVPVTRLRKAPRKVHDSQPLWSELNVQTRGGTLVYDITIGPFGNVTDVRQIRRGRLAGPSRVIADAWLRAIREWKFEPTLVGAERVAVCMTVTVTIDI